MLRLLAFAAFSALFISAPAWGGDIRNPLIEGETWADLRPEIIGDAELYDGASLFEVDAPYRAHDAAVVPVRIKQSAQSAQKIVKLFLIVDENPMPVAAEFTFGPSLDRLDLETRVRVDQYSNIRAIAETEDGRLWMTGRFVKASGGCSAPASKDMEAALAAVGQMKMRMFAPEAPTENMVSGQSTRPQAQIMVRHPNFSGFQVDQLTHLFIPAHFVDEISVFLGDEHLIHMTGGISLSEDPTFRFFYKNNGSDIFRIDATDTEGNIYKDKFSILGDS